MVEFEGFFCYREIFTDSCCPAGLGKSLARSHDEFVGASLHHTVNIMFVFSIMINGCMLSSLLEDI